MKMKHGFGFGVSVLLAAMLSSSLLAQVPGNATAPSPASQPANIPVVPTLITDPAPPATSTNTATPTKKPAKKNHTVTKKKPAVKKSTAAASVDAKKGSVKPAAASVVAAAPFIINGTATAKQNNINIRGQSHINSEVVGHLKKGESVTVLEEVTLKHPKTDEPAKWLKIQLPDSIHAWMNTPLIDVSNTVVKAHKVNLRGGPGENFSILGRLKAGDVIKPIGSKGAWTEVEAGTNAYAFVAAHLMTPQAAAPVAPVVPVTPPTPAQVENNNPSFPAANTVAANENNAAAHQLPAVVPMVPVAPAVQPAPDEPAPKRIVEREGLVGPFVSIQAPSHFALRSLDDGRLINYLYTSNTNISLIKYRGMTVLVSGEEELDERWPNTPVLTIQRIQQVK
jgi:uncharacterized protein YgiM (DUF1202 family)